MQSLPPASPQPSLTPQIARHRIRTGQNGTNWEARVEVELGTGSSLVLQGHWAIAHLRGYGFTREDAIAQLQQGYAELIKHLGGV